MGGIGWPLIIWTAVCIGFGLLGSDDPEKRWSKAWAKSFGYAILVWAVGLIAAFQFARML